MIKEGFIGKRIRIVDSKNRRLIGIEGFVIDESKNILIVEKNGREMKIIKDQCVFEVEGEKVHGKDIAKKT